MKQQGEIQIIATKVTLAIKDKLFRIAEQWNMSFYELAQALLLALVRACDDTRTPLSPKHETMIRTFLNTIISTDGSFNPLSIAGRYKEHIDGALLFVNRSPEMRPQMIAVTQGANGEWNETYNHDIMLLDFLRAADPKAASVLQREAARHDHFSVLSYLHDLIMQSQPSADARMSEDIDELFSEIRIATGDRINEDVHYKNHHNQRDYSCFIEGRKRQRADI